MGLAADHHRHSSASEDDDMATFNGAMQLVTAFAVPMTLKAVIELDVLEIISKACPGANLSAAEIASKIPTTNPEAAALLDRMLSYLASHSVLTCSLAAGHDGGVERRYSAAPMCKFLTKNKDGASLAPLLLLNLEKCNQDPWQELKHAVIEGANPFVKANGVTLYEKNQANMELNKAFHQGMTNLSTLTVKKMLEIYTGFQGVEKLVDVGGGIGTTIHMIVSEYPNINGVNFDLPHVISNAPSLSGVNHIAGDMFMSVPCGDAIFIQRVLHNWRDEDCLKVLRNCFKALPSSGKVIIVEPTIPEAPETNLPTKTALYFDIRMIAMTGGGKERTVKEFEFLAREAGFCEVRVACTAYFMSVLELLK